jgi:hypothetical protein
MVSWLLSIVVYTASRTKNFNRAELGALVESAKQFAVIRSWYLCSKWYPFPTSDILRNSQYVKFESAMSKHIWLLNSISNPSKCNWLCNQLWSPKMILAAMRMILELHSWLHSLQECHAHAERVTMSRNQKVQILFLFMKLLSILLIAVTPLWIIQEKFWQHQSDHEWFLGSSW